MLALPIRPLQRGFQVLLPKSLEVSRLSFLVVRLMLEMVILRSRRQRLDRALLYTAHLRFLLYIAVLDPLLLRDLPLLFFLLISWLILSLSGRIVKFLRNEPICIIVFYLSPAEFFVLWLGVFFLLLEVFSIFPRPSCQPPGLCCLEELVVKRIFIIIWG